MIDHIGIDVSDFDKSLRFYEKALKPLGLTIVMRENEGVLFGRDKVAAKAVLWIGNEGKTPTTPIHIAFLAESRAQVDAFYEAAMAAGGKDNGPPGIRGHYHPDYYAAFVLDPDGHNVEAVCHGGI